MSERSERIMGSVPGERIADEGAEWQWMTAVKPAPIVVRPLGDSAPSDRSEAIA